jgi:hypothetical protein
MKQRDIPGPAPVRGRRIAGRAQEDHILDPYSRKRKLRDGTYCPDCSAVYKAGRWQWTPKSIEAEAEPCPACRRVKDKFPAGIMTFTGEFARAHKDEILRLARHQEEVEQKEHPLNRLMGIEEVADGIVITTTDIHLPRRIGEAVQRAFHGELEEKFEEDGYFTRVTWQRAV